MPLKYSHFVVHTIYYQFHTSQESPVYSEEQLHSSCVDIVLPGF